MFLYRFLRVWIILLSKIFLRFKVKGRAFLPKEGGYIIASNHMSFLDPMMLGAASPRPLNFMARHSLFEKKIFGRLISHVGAFPVRREGADAAGMRRAIERLRRGRIVVVFPEGTRSQNGRLGPGRIGIAVLAAKAGVKIVPAVIKGTDKVWGKNSKFIKPYPVSVIFGEELDTCAILPDKPQRKNYEEFTDIIMNRLRRLQSENTEPFI